MITKVVLNTSYDFGEQSSRLVEGTELQVRNHGLAKIAGVEDIFAGALDGVEIPDNHTVVHVIAVGDMERWGFNRNCDGFSRADNQRKHGSFKTNGHVFRNHKNHDPKLATGSVLATAHNDPLERIELMLALDNDKCRDEVQELNKTGELAVSMGSKQSYDVCSYCLHKAARASDHCAHVKHHLGEVADNGVKVGMLNPDPNYFDISTVFKPAERVAYTLRKIAGGVSVMGGHDLAELIGLPQYDSEKLAMMGRIASIVKQQPALMRPLPENLETLPKSQLKKAASTHGAPAVLHALHQSGCMLSPADFGEVFLGTEDPDKLEAAEEAFSRDIPALMLDGEGPDSLEGCPSSTPLPLDMQGMLPATSMDDLPARDRVVKLTIVKKARLSVSYPDTAELRGLADLYAHYKIAFAKVNADHPGRVRNVARTFVL